MMNVLVLNSGSSTLKFQLIAIDPDRKKRNDRRLCRGKVERVGEDVVLSLQEPTNVTQKLSSTVSDLAASMQHLVHWITSDVLKDPNTSEVPSIDAVGHRVVHGGELFVDATLITDEVLKGIEACVELAPLHNPSSLEGIVAARRVFGAEVPQVAVFDTAFHETMPDYAYLYAIPFRLYREHKIRRYGFHGTSHRFVSERFAEIQGLSREQTNVITLHLGNGCSATAIRGGHSLDTSMGMTPLEGLVMGTRSGDLDPAVVNVIAKKESMSTQEVETLLNTKSGLLGISGSTNDMRELYSRAVDQDDERARLAITMFCYRARKYIGAFLACMGGADAIIFTGGVGENSSVIRARICEGLEWAGLKLNHGKNDGMNGREGRISTDDSRLQSFVIPTDEELLIARDTVRCVSESHSPELRSVARSDSR